MDLASPPGLQIAPWAGEPIDSLGPCGYGDWDQVKRSHAERADDARWRSELLVARIGSRVVGLANLHQSRYPALPDANVSGALGEVAPGLAEDRGADRLLFVGGHSGLRGGVAVMRFNDSLTSEAVLVAMVRRAVAEAAARDAEPVALFVPHPQVPGVLAGWATAPRATIGGQVWVLYLRGAASMDEFLASCHKDVRATWRHDVRRAAELDLAASPIPVSPELLSAGAHLIAAGKTRHGIVDNARFTEYRLRRWLSTYGGETAAWTFRDGDGTLLGLSIAEVTATTVAMVEIGIAADCPHRRHSYHELAFLAPMRFALDRRLPFIDLGTGHSLPKRSRGAVSTLQWHIVPA